jgi:hypothetical protein
VKAYKGFNPDMTCRGFQFTEGETYTEPKAELCKTGFHACLEPMDVFAYYHPSTGAVVHEVEVDDDVKPQPASDSKVASRRITIGARVNVMGMVKAHLEIVWDRVAKVRAAKPDQVSSGYQSTAASSGDRSTAAVSGAESIALAGGYQAMAKGAAGCWIVLAERAGYEDEFRILGVKAVKVGSKSGGIVVKPDTLYGLRGGKVVPVDIYGDEVTR